MRNLNSARFGHRAMVSATLAGTLLLTTLTVQAEEGVIAGFFRGTEMRTTGIGETCPGNPGGTSGYQEVGTVTASATGSYDFSNTGHHYSGSSQLAFYTSFDPADPTANRVGWAFIESTFEEGPITLQTGTEYTLVVQSRDCGSPLPAREEWSFVYRGDGQLSGPSVYPLPAYGAGSITSGSPTFNSPACGSVRYDVSGPIQVPETGDYRYSDSAVHFDLDAEVYFYENAFDPNDPQANITEFQDDGATIQLTEGVDYYLVTVPWGCGTAEGAYQYVLLGPSEEFFITEGVNGAWANFETLGQGQLMEVFPDSNQLFSAWFTWDTTQPDPGDVAEVGDPNHRWLTAQGGFEGDTATLDMFLSSGGLFDDPAQVGNDMVGTMSIQFTSCNEALVTYSMGALSGAHTMNRIGPDNLVSCNALRNQHKVPVQ